MDKEKFLASGLLEKYLLGIATPKEEQIVERYAAAFPDIKREIDQLRNGLEQYAKQFAVPPPPDLKDKIIDSINQSSTPENLPLSSFPPNQNRLIPTTISMPRWGLYALLGMLLLSTATTWWQKQNLNQQLDEAHAQMSACRDELAARQAEQKIFALLQDPQAQPVRLQGTAIAQDATAIVFWNDTSKEAAISPAGLPKPPTGKQYQVWADVDGVMINLGLIEPQNDAWQAIAYIDRAASINVTLEPRGGSEHPTVELLYANGIL